MHDRGRTFRQWCLRTYADSGKTKTVTRRKYDNILQALLHDDHKQQQHKNAKFKVWIKSKGFQVGTLRAAGGTGRADAKVLLVPVKTTVCGSSADAVSLKQVAVVEDFYDIIYTMHVKEVKQPGKLLWHVGQKKTYKAIAKTYAFLPREAVTRFLMSCTECQNRMHARGHCSEGKDPRTRTCTYTHAHARTRALLSKIKNTYQDDASVNSEDEADMSEPSWLPAEPGATSQLSLAGRAETMCHSPNIAGNREDDGKTPLFFYPHRSGGSYDSIKMEPSAEDLSTSRLGGPVAPDDDDDEHDEHDDSDKINDTEGVDPERLKAFNMFVRLFVDENLDRMVPISKQPKEKIQAIIESCSRQFPEFQERARKRIRTYLKSCRRMKKNGMETRPTPPHLTSAMAENILAAACESESRNAAKRMRLDAYHPASLVPSAYSLAASAFSNQEPQVYINGAGLSYGYRGYLGLGGAVSLTTGPTDLSMKSLSSTNMAAAANHSQLSQPEIAAVRQLIAGYRESAAFLLRSADELENLILQQN
uniref:Nucleolar protein 4-like b n=1 Tax=Hippocampus comes TaxID=109280 RepID=A0A3Q2YLP8_HIPCM